MTVKQWLNRGYRINNEIDELIKEQKQALLQATSTALNGGEVEKVQSSNGNTSERRFVNYVAYSETIDKRIDELYAVKNEILTAINTVADNTLRELLILRYIKFYTWEEIAVKMGYTFQWAYVLHKRALQNIEKILNS